MISRISVELMGEGHSCMECGDREPRPRADAETPPTGVVDSTGMYCSPNCFNHSRAAVLVDHLAHEIKEGWGHSQRTKDTSGKLFAIIEGLEPVRENSCPSCGRFMHRGALGDFDVFECSGGCGYKRPAAQAPESGVSSGGPNG